MNFNELKFYLKKYKILTLFLYLQVTLFFVILGTFISFVEELDYESKSLHQIYEGKAIYQLLDGYYDGDDYADFVSQSDYLNQLKEYYNELNKSSDFQYLSMFNHHILLKDTAIPEEFVEGYENGSQKNQQIIDNTTFTAVKSFQMNKQALDFFNLVASEGSTWNENDFKGTNNIMPVLLGSAYRKVFSIGDETTINYYGKTFTIRIIGFLKENSKLYFNNNSEFYLDKYIILPYREYDVPTSEADELFQQISYFAMINGYIVTDNDSLNIQNMMQRVEAIAQKTQFENYSFIGLNPHFQKYRGLMTVLQEDKLLVQSIFISTAVLNLIIISLFLLLQQKRRISFFAIHYINGASKLRLIKMQWLEISNVLFAAYLTNFIIFNQVLKIGDFKTQFFLLILCITMSFLVCIIPAFKLLSNPFEDYIHNQDVGGN